MTDIHSSSELEQQRLQFQAMLRDVEAEVDCNGSLTLEEVLSELDKVIATETPPGTTSSR